MSGEMRKLRRSFSYAWHGFRSCVRTERNLRIHLTAACYVTAAALIARLDTARLAVLCLCFALMISAELMNTAIERVCDRESGGYDFAVRDAKDIAAAGVFVCALFCVAVGALLFLTDGAIWHVVRVFYNHLWALGMLLLSIPAAIYFIFHIKRS